MKIFVDAHGKIALPSPVLRTGASGTILRESEFQKSLPSPSQIDLDRRVIFEIPAAARPAAPFSVTVWLNVGSEAGALCSSQRSSKLLNSKYGIRKKRHPV